MAKYTFSEYKKLRAEHDKEMECLDWIDGKDFVKLYNSVVEQWQKNPDGFCVTLTRPVNTLDTFKNDMGLWEWLHKEFPDKNHRPIVGWWPKMGWWAFYKNGNDLIHFNESGPWTNDIIYNIKTIDLWTGGAELTLLNDTKDYIVFDEIEFEK